MGRKKFAIGAVSAAVLAFAPAATAQSTSAQQGYSVPGGVVETQISNGPSQGPTPSTPSSPSSSSESSPTVHATQVSSAHSSSKLPFTGLDLALVVGAGGILLALGVGIRRLARVGEVA